MEISQNPCIFVIDLTLDSQSKPSQVVKTQSIPDSSVMMDYSKVGDSLFYTDRSNHLHRISFS